MKVSHAFSALDDGRCECGLDQTDHATPTVLPVPVQPAWTEQAACKNQTRDFFPAANESHQAATLREQHCARVCAVCSVFELCANYRDQLVADHGRADRLTSISGFWAGVSLDRRRRAVSVASDEDRARQAGYNRRYRERVRPPGQVRVYGGESDDPQERRGRERPTKRGEPVSRKIDYRTIELGKKYRDTISDFEGIATAYYTYLNGCVRVELSGKVIFDIDQVVLVDEPVPAQPKPGRTGGPRDHNPVAR